MVYRKIAMYCMGLLLGCFTKNTHQDRVFKWFAEITGLLQVDKPQTRDQIQQVLPEIIQNLADSGIVIKRLEVVLTNQQDQYTLKDQSSTAGQDNWSGQQSSPDPESQRNNTTYNEWLTTIDNVTEFTESQMQLTESSINVLI